MIHRRRRVKQNMDGEEEALCQGVEESRRSRRASATSSADAAFYYGFSLELGVFSAVAMALFWGVSVACAQALAGYVPVFQLNFVRFATTFLFVGTAVACGNLPVNVDRKRAALTVYCGIAAIDSLQCYDASRFIPLEEFGGLQAACLILLSSLMGLLLREKIGIPMAVSAVLSVSGLVFYTQPSFVFEKLLGTTKEPHLIATCANHSTSQPNDTGSSKDQMLSEQTKGYLLILGGTVGYVTRMTIQVRYLHDMKTAVILFWMSLSGAVFSAVVILCTETPTFPSTMGLPCMFLATGHSVSAALASTLSVIAMGFLPAITFSLMSACQLFVYSIVQQAMKASGKTEHNGGMEVIGAMLLFCGTILGPGCALWKQGFIQKTIRRRNSATGELED